MATAGSASMQLWHTKVNCDFVLNVGSYCSKTKGPPWGRRVFHIHLNLVAALFDRNGACALKHKCVNEQTCHQKHPHGICAVSGLH